MAHASFTRFAALGTATLLTTSCITMAAAPAFAEETNTETILAPETFAVEDTIEVQSGEYYLLSPGELLLLWGTASADSIIEVLDLDGMVLGTTITDAGGYWSLDLMPTISGRTLYLTVLNQDTGDRVDIIVDILASVITVAPAPPTLSTPAVGEEATVVLPDVEGVDYTVVRDGNSYVVTATPWPGYELDGETSWTLTIPDVEQPPTLVTPLPPKLSQPAPGERATVILPEVEGITYIAVPNPQDPENVVSVFVYEIKEGYALAPGSVTYWELTLPPIVQPETGAKPDAGQGTGGVGQPGSTPSPVSGASNAQKPASAAGNADGSKSLVVTGDETSGALAGIGLLLLGLAAGVMRMRRRTR